MGTIKFRQFCNDEDNHEYGMHYYNIYQGAIKDGYWSDPMLYIGLKDKNGKEIYEGDILKDDFGNIAKIEWDHASASFEPNDGLDHGLWETCLLNPDRTKARVIGNIYENPELLSNQLS